MTHEEAAEIRRGISKFLIETCAVCLGPMEIDIFDRPPCLIYSCRNWNCTFDAISIDKGKIHWHPMPINGATKGPDYGRLESLEEFLNIYVYSSKDNKTVSEA